MYWRTDDEGLTRKQTLTLVQIAARDREMMARMLTVT
jgi:hypothetical protein